MAAIGGFRVKLDLASVKPKIASKLWFYVDALTLPCVKDLKEAVCKRFKVNIDTNEIEIRLQDGLIPAEESINVLSPNDLLTFRKVDSVVNKSLFDRNYYYVNVESDKSVKSSDRATESSESDRKSKNKKRQRSSNLDDNDKNCSQSNPDIVVNNELVNNAHNGNDGFEKPEKRSKRRKKVKRDVSSGESESQTCSDVQREVSVEEASHNSKNNAGDSARKPVTTEENSEKQKKPRRRRHKKKSKSDTTPHPTLAESVPKLTPEIADYIVQSNSRRHLRFDDDNVPPDITGDPCPSKELESNVPEKEPETVAILRDFSKYPNLEGPPRVNDIIAYRVLELSQDYCPEVSEYRVGKVLSYDVKNDDLVIELQNPLKIKQRRGKFELVERDETEADDGYDEREDVEDAFEYQTMVTVAWKSLMAPKMITD